MNQPQFKSAEVRYQTAPIVPPPYTHFYTLAFRPAFKEYLHVDLSITYTDREDLDEEDIIGEGFTLDDNYSWSGRLPLTWLETATSLIRKTRLQAFDEDKLTDNDEYFLLTLEQESGGAQSGVPTPKNDWQYFIQELMQAVYEASEREKPFEFTYLDHRSGSPTEVHLTGLFSRREVQVDIRRKGRNQTRTLPWNDLQSVMEAIYGVEYLPEEALAKPAPNKGQYLNLGEEEWYELGPAVVGPEPALAYLRKTLDRLAAL